MSNDIGNKWQIITPSELKDKIDRDKELLYSDEFRNLLDARYCDYRDGIEMISAAESGEKIQMILASKK
ncbi:MAG: hypothetical protein M3O71_04660 [Bacteroidota bacterium]|nr:hypothetical protein [Bacteroidota bacterium]